MDYETLRQKTLQRFERQEEAVGLLEKLRARLSIANNVSDFIHMEAENSRLIYPLIQARLLVETGALVGHQIKKPINYDSISRETRQKIEDLVIQYSRHCAHIAKKLDDLMSDTTSSQSSPNHQEISSDQHPSENAEAIS